MFTRTSPLSARWFAPWGVLLAALIPAVNDGARADTSSPASKTEIPSVTAALAPPAAPGQRATLLPDGRWLLTGGEIDGEPSGRIAVYSNSQTTVSAVTLNAARSGHTATVLTNGTVFIFGGVGPDGQLVPGAEIFDPLHGTITSQAAIALTARTQHSATLLTNGEILIAGGRDANDQALSSVQLWDPLKQIAPVESSLQAARSAHEAELLATGEALVWGGRGPTGQVLANGEIYNSSTKLFEGPVNKNDSRVVFLSASRAEPPYLADSLPGSDAAGVALNSILGIRFSKPLPIAQLNAANIVLVGPSGAVAGSVVGAEAGMLAFFSPTMELRPATTYTLFVTNLADEQGNTLPSKSIRFTTLKIESQQTPVAPSTMPVQSSTSPAAVMAAAAAKAPEPAAVTIAQKLVPHPVAASQLPVARPPSPASMAEDWIPQAQNRHGAWRVLGLANDPPLSTDVRTAAALKAASNQTAVAGQVLRLNGLPLAGVSISAGTRLTTTDGQGRFLLGGVPAGPVELKVDGTGVINNGRHYTAHYLPVMAKQGITSVLSYPIYLVRVDPASETPISSPADHEIVLTHPSMPGLEVRIPKGAVIRDPDGKVVTKISITPIPIDRAPSPVPAPFAVYFTLQPAGAWVDGDATKGVKVIYPNYQGAAAGTLFNFWNDAISEQGWHVYGHGKVSQDQSQILPDDSVTFRRLMHFSAATAPQYIPGEEPSTAPVPNGCKEADPVDCGTGLFEHTVTDLSVNDVVPITLTRMYRTNDNQVHAFGVGTDLSYNMRLVSPYSVSGNASEIDVVLANGARVQYFLSPYPGRNDGYRNPGSPVAALSGSVMLSDSSQIFLKDGTVLQFSNSTVRQLASITDRHGNVVTLTTTANPQSAETQTALPITQITSPNGRYIQLFYDSSNRITSAVDNAGRTTSYAYDAQSHLISATDANGFTESYGYDPTSNNMNLVTDKRGNAATKNLFDGNGRVSQQTLADGAIWKFSYVLDSNGNVTHATVTDPRNYVKQHAFNSSGYPTQTILAFGKPEQQTITTTYNGGNLPLQVTDALGRQTVYGYDALGDLTSVTALAGTANAVTYQMAYDPTFHQLAGVTDPLGHTATMTIGASGNTVAITDALGNTTSVGYNPQGLMTSTIDPLGNATQIAYGTAGNISSVTDPLNRQTHFGMDELGRLVGLVDPLGNSTQYAIDAMDRLSSVTNAIGGTTNLTYDQNGNALTVTDPKSVKQTFTYDARNRRHSYLDPAGKTETYNYDGMGNLTSKIDRKSQTTSITYDGINRPTLVTFQDASTVAITWDAGNRPTKFVDSLNGNITRVYDGLDRLTQETTSQGVINYTYDLAGRRQTMTVAGQPVINYTFDNDNRLTQVAQGTNVLGFGYDSAGRRTTITLPNTVIGTFGFDSANQLTSISYMHGATSVGTLGYGYDLGGRLTSLTGTLAGFVPPTAVPSLTYDGTNRLTNWGGTSISYDANGNITNFGSATYTWNARNELTATSGGGATFSYDALGRRVSTTVNSVTTPYLYDGQNPAMISTNQMLAGAGLDEVYAQINSNGTTSYLRDSVNSTVAVTNSSAATTANYAYSPYGDSVGTGTSTTPLQYTGRENDGATGLYYYRARYYSPQLDRFISEDPIGLGGGTNYYAYVRGNPISLRDPTGKDPVIGATVGAISGAFFGGLGAYVQGGSAEDIAIAAAYGLGSGAVIGAIDPSFGIATLAIVGGVAGGVGDLIGQTYAGAGTACKPIKWGSTIGAVAGGAIGGGGGLLYGRLAMAAGDSELVATSMGSVLSSVPGVIYPSIGDDMFPTKSTGCGCSQ